MQLQDIGYRLKSESLSIVYWCVLIDIVMIGCLNKWVHRPIGSRNDLLCVDYKISPKTMRPPTFLRHNRVGDSNDSKYCPILRLNTGYSRHNTSCGQTKMVLVETA